MTTEEKKVVQNSCHNEVAALKKEVADLKSEIANLRASLAKETQRRVDAEEVVIKVKKDSAHTQVIVEQEEEYISNMLMKRLAELKAEKEQLALKIEEEEEYLTNNLQMKLNEVKREKIEMENQLEQEQEYIVNKLQRRMDELKTENQQLERKVEVLSRSNSPASSLRSLDHLPRGDKDGTYKKSRNPSNSSSLSHQSSSLV